MNAVYTLTTSSSTASECSRSSFSPCRRRTSKASRRRSMLSPNLSPPRQADAALLARRGTTAGEDAMNWWTGADLLGVLVLLPALTVVFWRLLATLGHIATLLV